MLACLDSVPVGGLQHGVHRLVGGEVVRQPPRRVGDRGYRAWVRVVVRVGVGVKGQVAVSVRGGVLWRCGVRGGAGEDSL